jgi:ABC-type lipoprotein export system ATPase subunit
LNRTLEIPATGFGPATSAQLLFPATNLVEGQLLQVEGSNGSGKTTLMRALFSTFATTSPATALLLPQNYASLLFPYQPVWWNIALPDLLCSAAADQETLHELARKALAQFEVNVDLFKYPAQLSGGEQHIVAIARFARATHRIFFLDEPTTGLDRRNSSSFWKFVRTLVAEGKFVILVTHDADVPTVEVSRVEIAGTNGKKMYIKTERFREDLS